MDVLESKTFLALDIGETTLTIGQGDEALRFILDFVVDEKADQKVEWQAVDNKTLKGRLINFSNPLGTTFVKPVEVGTFANRKLHLLLYVKKAGEKGQFREVTVTAYLGEGVPNGHD